MVVKQVLYRVLLLRGLYEDAATKSSVNNCEPEGNVNQMLMFLWNCNNQGTY